MKIASIIGLMLISLALPGAKGSIYTISDDRIRGMDISPVLGRGYSIMTNQFQSTCLMVDETTVPSYDYKFRYKNVSKNTGTEEVDTGSSGGESSGGCVFSCRRAVESSTSRSQTNKVDSQVQTISTTMSIMRYYSSVREELSPLADDAKELIESEDYVGFFKACGPNYTRGIRRFQEVTAIFNFFSTSEATSDEFFESFKQRKSTGFLGLGRKKIRRKDSMTGKKFNSINSSLTIQIVGFGLGLSQEGSESLVATKMDEHDGIMKFAFRSMTKNTNAHQVGMVYGIEVVPWVNNSAFQVAAKLGTDSVSIPMPRSLMPRSILRVGVANTAANDVWNISRRDDFTCKDPLRLLVDKFGYCCEVEQLYNPVDGDYTGVSADPATHVCRPIYILDPNVLKDNLSNNAEFIARLDSAIRYKLAALATLESCIAAVNSIPTDYHYNLLKKKDSIKYDGLLEIDLSVIELKMSIDPKGDYSVVKHMAMELDEWIEMFYSPCYAALFGSNIGTLPDVDVDYFKAYPWYSHPACMTLSCITNNQRWDRQNGGCVPSMIIGTRGAPYNAGEDEKCSKTIDEYDNERCKYSQDDLVPFARDTQTCWSMLPSAGQVDFLVNNYCNPEVLSGEYPTQEERAVIVAAVGNCAA